MPPTQYLPHEVANILRPTRKDILELGQKHGYLRADKRHIRIRDRKEEFYFSDEDREWAARNRPPGYNPLSGEPKQVILQEEHLESIQEAFGRFKTLLDSCANGQSFTLAVMLDSFFKYAAKANFLSADMQSVNSWRARLNLNDHVKKGEIPFEDFLYIYGLLLPCLDRSSPIDFGLTKKCAECGCFYQAKGKKAIYCSEKCRSRARARIKSASTKKEEQKVGN